jgi:hypothetical protein
MENLLGNATLFSSFFLDGNVFDPITISKVMNDSQITEGSRFLFAISFQKHFKKKI